MKLGQASCQGQADAGTPAAVRFVQLHEGRENLLRPGCRYSLPVVRDGYPRPFAVRPGRDTYERLGVFPGVVEKIADYFRHGLAVGRHHDFILLRLEADDLVAPRYFRLETLYRLPEHGHDVGLGEIKGHGVGVELPEIEQLVGQIQQAVAVVSYRREVLSHLFAVRLFVHDVFQRARYERQGSAYLVGDVREKVYFGVEYLPVGRVAVLFFSVRQSPHLFLLPCAPDEAACQDGQKNVGGDGPEGCVPRMGHDDAEFPPCGGVPFGAEPESVIPRLELGVRYAAFPVPDLRPVLVHALEHVLASVVFHAGKVEVGNGKREVRKVVWQAYFPGEDYVRSQHAAFFGTHLASVHAHVGYVDPAFLSPSFSGQRRVEADESVRLSEDEIPRGGLYRRLVVVLVARHPVVVVIHHGLPRFFVQTDHAVVGAEPHVAGPVLEHFVGDVVGQSVFLGVAREPPRGNVVFGYASPVRGEPYVPPAVEGHAAYAVGADGIAPRRVLRVIDVAPRLGVVAKGSVAHRGNPDVAVPVLAYVLGEEQGKGLHPGKSHSGCFGEKSVAVAQPYPSPAVLEKGVYGAFLQTQVLRREMGYFHRAGVYDVHPVFEHARPYFVPVGHQRQTRRSPAVFGDGDRFEGPCRGVVNVERPVFRGYPHPSPVVGSHLPYAASAGRVGTARGHEIPEEHALPGHVVNPAEVRAQPQAAVGVAADGEYDVVREAVGKVVVFRHVRFRSVRVDDVESLVRAHADVFPVREQGAYDLVVRSGVDFPEAFRCQIEGKQLVLVLAQDDFAPVIAHGVDVFARYRVAPVVLDVLREFVPVPVIEEKSRAVGAYPHPAVPHAHALRVVLVSGFFVRGLVPRERLSPGVVAESALRGGDNPDVALPVVGDLGYPVRDGVSSGRFCPEEGEFLVFGIEDEHALVRSGPDVAILVLEKGRNVVVAHAQFRIVDVVAFHTAAVVAAKAVLRAEPHEAAAVLDYGLDAVFRQAASYVDLREKIGRGLFRDSAGRKDGNGGDNCCGQQFFQVGVRLGMHCEKGKRLK